MGGVEGEMGIDNSAKEIVATFLREGNAELEDTVVEYISEAVRTEAFHPTNGRSAKSMADALRLFAPSINASNLEGRVEDLLEKMRQTGPSGKNGTNIEDGRINQEKVASIIDAGSPEAQKDDCPVPSRSPPAAAFLASSTMMRELLRSGESLDDYYGGQLTGGSPTHSYSGQHSSVENDGLESGGSSGNLSTSASSALATGELSVLEVGRARESAGSPNARSSLGRSIVFQSNNVKSISSIYRGPEYYDKLSGQFGSLTVGGIGSPRSTPPPANSPPSESPKATRSNSPGSGAVSVLGSGGPLQNGTLSGTTSVPGTSSSALSSFSVSLPGIMSHLPVRRSLGTQLSFGRISLNPNAAEFVPTGKPGSSESSPSSLSSPQTRGGGFSSRSAPNLQGEPLVASRSSLEKSISVNSNASDDEYRRYWRAQLPDELLSYDDVSAEPLALEEVYEYDDPPVLAPRGLSLVSGRGLVTSPGSGFGLETGPGSLTGPPGPRGSPLPLSPRGPMNSTSPSSSAWGMNAGPGQPPTGASSNSIGPPPGSPLHSHAPGSPLSGGVGPGNGVNGYGYGPRPQLSPHPSPPRGTGVHYSPPPGGRYPLGPGGVVKEGPLTPPGHGYGRPFVPPDHRPGLPTPFQLPPGQSGQRERPPLPPWGVESYDMGGPLGDLRADNVFREDGRMEDPVAILASEFPGFAAESLADIFYANGGDLQLTMEMLAQLELQDEGGRSPGRLPPPPPALTPMDFPALPNEMGNSNLPHPGLGLESPPLPLRRLDEGERPMMARPGPPGLDPRSGPDFAAVVRKHAQQAQWQQFERNGMEMGVLRGRSPGPGPGAGPYLGEGRGGPSERMDNYGHPREIHRAPPQPWLETGDAVTNMYAEMREEARDHARVRNVYFEQATQAYMAGNKALAKDLSAKGQWHNEQMKAAHAKAGDAIFRQRNTVSGYLSGRVGPGSQARVIDLHGLHVNEAIPFLKRELAHLRAAARNTGQRQQIYVCVGTGHHTKGRNNPRIPLAVEHHLVEEERVQVVETQPGMLRVVV